MMVRKGKRSKSGSKGTSQCGRDIEIIFHTVTSHVVTAHSCSLFMDSVSRQLLSNIVENKSKFENLGNTRRTNRHSCTSLCLLLMLGEAFLERNMFYYLSSDLLDVKIIRFYELRYILVCFVAVHFCFRSTILPRRKTKTRYVSVSFQFEFMEPTTIVCVWCT